MLIVWSLDFVSSGCHNTRVDKHISIFHQVRNIYYFQIGFGLRKLRSWNVIRIYIINIFNVFFDYLKVWWQSNLICCYNNAMLINLNKVCYNIWLDIFECSVQISNIQARCNNGLWFVIITHKNNNLLFGEIFHSHVDSELYFSRTINQIINIFNFLGQKIWKVFFKL